MQTGNSYNTASTTEIPPLQTNRGKLTCKQIYLPDSWNLLDFRNMFYRNKVSSDQEEYGKRAAVKFLLI